MKDAIAMVREFHEKFDVPVLAKPAFTDRWALRRMLINEEASEVNYAINYEKLPQIAKELADLIYVCIGAALEFGIPLDEVFSEVHRTNMLKSGGSIRADGKIMKPAGWQPPNIAAILEAAK